MGPGEDSQEGEEVAICILVSSLQSQISVSIEVVLESVIRSSLYKAMLLCAVIVVKSPHSGCTRCRIYPTSRHALIGTHRLSALNRGAHCYRSR